MATMMLCGLGLAMQDVLTLSALAQQAGFGGLGERLEQAVDREVYALALDEVDREMILRALDDPPTDGLTELHGVLLADLERRKGLA